MLISYPSVIVMNHRDSCISGGYMVLILYPSVIVMNHRDSCISGGIWC